MPHVLITPSPIEDRGLLEGFLEALCTQEEKLKGGRGHGALSPWATRFRADLSLSKESHSTVWQSFVRQESGLREVNVVFRAAIKNNLKLKPFPLVSVELSKGESEVLHAKITFYDLVKKTEEEVTLDGLDTIVAFMFKGLPERLYGLSAQSYADRFSINVPHIMDALAALTKAVGLFKSTRTQTIVDLATPISTLEEMLKIAREHLDTIEVILGGPGSYEQRTRKGTLEKIEKEFETLQQDILGYVKLNLREIEEKLAALGKNFLRMDLKVAEKALDELDKFFVPVMSAKYLVPQDFEAFYLRLMTFRTQLEEKRQKIFAPLVQEINRLHDEMRKKSILIRNIDAIDELEQAVNELQVLRDKAKERVGTIQHPPLLKTLASIEAVVDQAIGFFAMRHISVPSSRKKPQVRLANVQAAIFNSPTLDSPGSPSNSRHLFGRVATPHASSSSELSPLTSAGASRPGSFNLLRLGVPRATSTASRPLLFSQAVDSVSPRSPRGLGGSSSPSKSPPSGVALKSPRARPAVYSRGTATSLPTSESGDSSSPSRAPHRPELSPGGWRSPVTTGNRR